MGIWIDGRLLLLLQQIKYITRIYKQHFYDIAENDRSFLHSFIRLPEEKAKQDLKHIRVERKSFESLFVN